MNQSLRLLCLLLFSSNCFAQNILLDENYSDWDNGMLIYEDAPGDGQSNGIDIQRVWAANDQTYFYLRFELGKEINIQDDNEFTIYLDTDNDLSTGKKINGIGAEFEWIFGERGGSIYQADGDSGFVGHEDIDLMSSPTVSSSDFEIAFRRSADLFGADLDISGTIAIRLEDNSFNGDDAPSEIGGITYNVNETVNRDFHTYTLDRSPTADFRLMSYNILADNLFDASRSDAFRRQFQATLPEIIAFQEIRSYNSSETKDVIEQYLPGTWFHEKSGFDIVLLSKFPILQRESIDGNAAFLLDVNGKELVVINIHLPCCDNNSSRQNEADAIMEYIRNLQTGGNNIKVDANTPIIITGDSNLVGFREQQTTLITGDIVQNNIFGPDVTPDWDDSILEDALPLATGTPYAKTWYNPFGSFSSGRLDYIIYTGSTLWRTNTFALSSQDMTFADRQLYGLNSTDTPFASDHLPTVADFQFTSVDVEEEEFSSVKIYPNPALDIIHVELGELSISQIEIIDYTGRSLKLSYNSDVSLQNILPGQYYLKITHEEGVSLSKFVKL